MKSYFSLLPIFFLAYVAAQEEGCGPENFAECITPMYNASFGHQNGLFQTVGDLFETCPILKTGVTCIRAYAEKCGTDMIAEDFNDEFEKPIKLVEEICNDDSTLRAEYLQNSECLRRHSDEFSACTTKIQEFMSTLEPKNTDEERTATCLYELMVRSCYLSSSANECGLGTANFVRKALQHTPSSGLTHCTTEDKSQFVKNHQHNSKVEPPRHSPSTSRTRSECFRDAQAIADTMLSLDRNPTPEEIQNYMRALTKPCDLGRK